MSTQVAIVDYGMGNLRSVEKALQRVGTEPVVTSEHDRIAAADGVVLPGVGAFPKAMERVTELGLDRPLRERVEARAPLLGICLGMQLLFERSSELGGAEGLGLIGGDVATIESRGLKLPQIGWNPVGWRRASRLTAGLPSPCAFYHVHSFAPRPARSEDVLGAGEYGSEFVTAVERDPVYGVQFHPEKSGEHGLRLLANFTAVCSAEAGTRRAA